MVRIPRIIGRKRKRRRKEEINIDTDHKEFCEYIRKNIHLILEQDIFCGFEYDVFMQGYEPLDVKKEIIDKLFGMFIYMKDSFIILNNKIMEYPINNKCKKKELKKCLLGIYGFMIEEIKPRLVGTNENILSYHEALQIILDKHVACSVSAIEAIRENESNLEKLFDLIEEDYEQIKNDDEYVSNLIKQFGKIDVYHKIEKYEKKLSTYFTDLQHLSMQILTCKY